MYKKKNYMFGYGSILSSESRKITADNGGIYPVRVKGLKRYWSTDCNYRATGVGVKLDENSFTNGILVEVTAEAVQEYRKRESHYHPHPLNLKQIEFLKENIDLQDAFCWLSPIITFPSKELPIIQSYLDVALSGAIETDLILGNKNYEFTKEFIKTTDNWNTPWVNDRKKPSYTRAINYKKIPQAHLNLIDELLISNIPKKLVQDNKLPRLEFVPKNMIMMRRMCLQDRKHFQVRKNLASLFANFQSIQRKA